jgi:hypothetical protein
MSMGLEKLFCCGMGPNIVAQSLATLQSQIRGHPAGQTLSSNLFTGIGHNHVSGHIGSFVI